MTHRRVTRRSHSWRGAVPWLGLASIAVLLSSCESARSPEARSWWSHVRVLSADSLEGRNTGSEGHRKAADYVAEQFRLHGAQPAGTEGFIQTVVFVSRVVREEECSLSLVRDGVETELDLGEDANLGMSHDSPEEFEAEAVFIGYGISVPEHDYDDREGLDLRGKVAVHLRGGPSFIPGPLRAHAQSTEERWSRLREAGVVGLVSISNPASTDVPWERSTLARLRPSMSLAEESLDKTPGLELSVRVNPERAEKLFEGSGHRFSEILALADSGVALPRFSLPGSIRARVRYTRSVVESQNVVGVIPGTDPDLGHEYVALTAHLDHLGIGGAIAGDSIYNGAMDNAAGVSTLIEVARLARESEVPLRRSLLLLAVTGEEKGLEGSRYFMAHPTVPAENVVANVNMDMFLPIVPLRTVTVFGLEESDLGDVAGAVAAEMGLRVQADPEPDRNRFIRSDQYNFIRRGIPALMLTFGHEKGSPEERIFRDWIKRRYHAPSDDATQVVDHEAAAKFNRLMFELCREVANRPERPSWKSDSFFRRYASPRAVSGGVERRERGRAG